MSRKQRLKKLQGKTQVKKTQLHLPSLSRFQIHLILSFLVLFVYSLSLTNQFVSDDVQGILQNPNRASFTANLPFGPQSFFHGLIRTMTASIAGTNPLPYRLVNILFHAGSTNLIFLILSLLFSPFVALVSALIFAVHPLLTESVTWIAGGSYSSSCFFILLSLYLYLKSPKLSWGSLFSYLISLSLSPTSIAFAPILFVYELSRKNFKKSWQRLTPYFLLTTLFLSLSLLKVPLRTATNISSSGGQATSQNLFLQIPIAISNYLSLFFWPDKLTLYHSEMSYSQNQFIVFVLIFLSLLYLIYRTWFKNRFLSFWLIWFLISLAPSLTPWGTNWVVAERYAYLATIGLIVSFTILYEKYLKPHLHPYFTLSLFSLILLCLSAKTISRNLEWQDDAHLWQATARTSPSSPNTHLNLGYVYYNQKKYTEAEKEILTAININPRLFAVWFHLGETYRLSGQYDKAISAFQKSLENNPDIWQASLSLGETYRQTKQYAQAETELQQVIAINPQSLDARKILSAVFLESNQKEKALTLIKETLQIYPNDPDINHLFSLTQTP